MVLLVVAISMSLLAYQGIPGAFGASAKPFRVGYSAAGLIDELQVTWSKGAAAEITAAGGQVTTIDSQNKISKQVADIEDLLARGIDYLIINPVDEHGIVPAIQEANKAGIPVVTIDRKAAGGNVAVHVGFDNYKAGYDAGVFIAKQNNNTGKVAQLMGAAGSSVVRERAQGFRDAIKKYPNMKIVFEQYTDWDTAKAASRTEDMLTAQPDVVGIWSHADAIIMGAVQVLKSRGLTGKVVTVGMGMYGGGPEAIKAGDLTASWELFPEQLGKLAGQAVVKIHNGETVPSSLNTQMVFVTKLNIDQYLNK